MKENLDGHVIAAVDFAVAADGRRALHAARGGPRSLA